MGWNIYEALNEPKLTLEQIDTLTPTLVAVVEHVYSDEEVLEELFQENDDGTYSMYFNSDHMEWMDWLTSSTTLLEAISKAGGTGRVAFGSNEGDNEGARWGVALNGDGTWHRIEQKSVWSTVA